jgi:hypothetical protein
VRTSSRRADSKRTSSGGSTLIQIDQGRRSGAVAISAWTTASDPPCKTAGSVEPSRRRNSDRLPVAEKNARRRIERAFVLRATRRVASIRECESSNERACSMMWIRCATPGRPVPCIGTHWRSKPRTTRDEAATSTPSMRERHHRSARPSSLDARAARAQCAAAIDQSACIMRARLEQHERSVRAARSRITRDPARAVRPRRGGSRVCA